MWHVALLGTPVPRDAGCCTEGGGSVRALQTPAPTCDPPTQLSIPTPRTPQHPPSPHPHEDPRAAGPTPPRPHPSAKATSTSHPAHPDPRTPPNRHQEPLAIFPPPSPFSFHLFFFSLSFLQPSPSRPAPLSPPLARLHRPFHIRRSHVGWKKPKLLDNNPQSTVQFWGGCNYAPKK